MGRRKDYLLESDDYVERWKSEPLNTIDLLVLVNYYYY